MNVVELLVVVVVVVVVVATATGVEEDPLNEKILPLYLMSNVTSKIGTNLVGGFSSFFSVFFSSSIVNTISLSVTFVSSTDEDGVTVMGDVTQPSVCEFYVKKVVPLKRE